jgi:hypothetical protein
MPQTQIFKTQVRDYLDLKDQGRCPFCKQHVCLGSFRDNLSVKEYRISGLCQSCQDGVFGSGTGVGGQGVNDGKKESRN